MASWQELYREHGHELPVDQWITLVGTIGAPFDPYAHLEVLAGPLDRAAVLERRRDHELSLTDVEELRPGVLDYLDAAVTSHEFGAPKEHARFWQAALAKFAYDPGRSLFADDNSKMLEAARSAGIRWVYGIRHWDTKGSQREHVDHPAVDSVAELG